MDCLRDITFLSNSDAHSQSPQSLGRVFNRMDLEAPSFEEIVLALARRDGRRVTLNVGLDPRLGKYFSTFCSKCRRRAVSTIGVDAAGQSIDTDGYASPEYTEDFLHFQFVDAAAHAQFIDAVSAKQVPCAGCRADVVKKSSKAKPSIPKLQLGVQERIAQIATSPTPVHPPHRPEYLDIIPLVEMIRAVVGVKSATSKKVLQAYDRIIDQGVTEFQVLTELTSAQIQALPGGDQLAPIIQAFKEHTITFTPGGGGTFGSISLEPIG
jgi:PHP family Zn ribbon phosphoesterase